MSLFSELRNRNVFRVAAAYVFTAWLAIQVVETIFPAFGFGDGAVRVVVIILAIGLVPALVFSWIFEITPEGLKREAGLDHDAPIARQATRRFDRAIIVVLTLAVGFFAFDKFVLDPVRVREIEKSTAERVRSETLVESYGDRSIAVMPFVNMSEDPANEYFSDGIAEELLNLLAKIPRLRVISQSSSFALKGKGLGIPEVAERLNVAFVLEGSVRKSGDRVRITAQLIEAGSDTHLWSESYDRTLDDVFAIQDEISAAIVGELKDKLKLDIGASPKVSGTINAEAHDAMLRGRHLAAQRIPGSRTRAVAEFEKAVSLDPAFALAHAELATILLLGGCGDVTDAECIAAARPHVEKAMMLDPSLAEAHVAAGWLAFPLGNSDESRAHFRRAIELNPNYAQAYVWMANMGLFSSPEEAFAARETAVRLDPLSPLTNNSYIHALLVRDRLAEADRQIEKYASIEPKAARILHGYRSSLGGNWTNYILSYLEVVKTGTDDLTYSWAAHEDTIWHLAAIGLEDEALRMAGSENVMVELWLGNPESAIALAQVRLAEQPENIDAQLDMAVALAHAGKYAQARPWLERGWHFLGGFNVDWGFSSGLGRIAEALIVVFRDAGDEVGAERVLGEFKGHIRRYRDGGIVLTQWNSSIDYLEGVAAYLAGERDTGLALISMAVEDGYWIRPPAAFQQAMHQDSGFAAILEKQKARQARERKKLLDVVCTDNPYAEVWQPSAETCGH